MASIVAVSPTLSDAVQSVGGTLARHAGDGHEVVLVTVFDEHTTTATENEVAATLGLSGIVAVNLPPGAEHRFDGVTDDDAEAATAAGAALALTLSRLEPGLVLSPIGLTGHVDARIINDTLDALTVPRLRWLDLPYALTRTPGAPLGAGEVVAVPISVQLDAKLQACALIGGADEASLRKHATSEGVRLGAGEPVEILLSRTASAPTD